MTTVEHIQAIAEHDLDVELRRAAHQWLADARRAREKGLDEPPIPRALTPRPATSPRSTS